MEFAVLGIAYQNEHGEVIGDDIVVMGSEWLQNLSGDEWYSAVAKCCKKLVNKEYRKRFSIYFRSICSLNELEKSIVDMRCTLNDFWQMRYDLGQSVPLSFTPVSTGG